MKRLLTVLFAAAMMFPFAACQKDNNTETTAAEAPVPPAKLLVGTVWEGSASNPSNPAMQLTLRIEFLQDNGVDIKVGMAGQTLPLTGTYTYEGTLTQGTGVATVESMDITLNFTIAGDKASTEYMGMTFVLTRVQ